MARALATHAPTAPRLSDVSKARSRRTTRRAWLYAAPAATVLIGMFVIPLGLAVWMSFHKWPLLGDAQPFNFPTNYTAISDDRLFSAAVGFTVKYTAIITVVLLTLSLGLALLVQESKRRVNGVLRTVFFLPVVTGLTTAALLFLGLLSPSAGPLDDMLAQFGIKVDWLGQPTTALISTVVMMTWRFAGFYMIILLAGLQAIPRELYEAAAIDGANRWRALRSITMPLMRSNLALSTVLIVTGGMVAFEQFYVMTRGGPDNSTVTMVMTIFRQAFSQFNLGVAAAMSVVVLLGLVVLNVLQMRLLRDTDEVAR
jgi:multiple sugar transport system permease protein